MATIPIHDRTGAAVAATTVDDVDADLGSRNWFRQGSKGYAATYLDGRGQYLHTIILERMGHPAGTYEVCDHENRDHLDNSRSNLRPTTVSENRRNCDGNFGPTPMAPIQAVCEECSEVFFRPRKTHKPTVRFCSRSCQVTSSNRGRDRSVPHRVNR